MPSRAKLPSTQLTQHGWLAVMLAVVVISLCFSQRMGITVACAYDHAAMSASHSDINPNLAANTTLIAQNNLKNKDVTHDQDHDSCSLSEQLLSKILQSLDPLFIAILLLFAWWITPIVSRWFLRRPNAPLLFLGRRRHLVLCVFRE